MWAYRKAASAIEDLPALAIRPGELDVAPIYRQMGRKGLDIVPGAACLAVVVEEQLSTKAP